MKIKFHATAKYPTLRSTQARVLDWTNDMVQDLPAETAAGLIRAFPDNFEVATETFAKAAAGPSANKAALPPQADKAVEAPRAALKIEASEVFLAAAVDVNVIERNGPWFSFRGKKLGRGVAEAVAFLAEHPDVLDNIAQAMPE